MVHHLRSRTIASNPSVLEIGSEVPQVAEFLQRGLDASRARFRCVDISPVSVELLRSRGWDAQVVDVSTDPLPFETSTFDVVVMSEVLEHLVDPDHALREVRRVLGPTGILVLTTPNLSSWFNRLLLLTGHQPVFTETSTEWAFGRGSLVGRSRPVGHLRVSTVRALRELLDYHGFSIEVLEGLGLERGAVPGRLLRAMDRGFARIPTLAAATLVIGSLRDISGRTSPPGTLGEPTPGR